jgi:hypothetical protein
MPHANDQLRFKRIVGQMRQVKIATLAAFRGEPAKPIDDLKFPAFGKRDADIFENNRRRSHRRVRSLCSSAAGKKQDAARIEWVTDDRAGGLHNSG